MLSQMIRQLFTENPLAAFPTVGLFIFMVVFAGIGVRVWRRRAAAFDDVARLPLEEEEVRHER